MVYCCRLWEIGGLLKSCIHWVPASTISPSAICYSRPIKCIWWHSRTFWALNQMWSADPLSNDTVRRPPPHYDVMSWIWPKVFGTWILGAKKLCRTLMHSVSAFRLDLLSNFYFHVLIFRNYCGISVHSLGPEAKRISFGHCECKPSSDFREP